MAILQVPVTKGKGFIDIETNDIPEAVYAEALLQGLKVLLNRGASKITKENHPDEKVLREEAMLQAEKQKQQIMDGTIKLTGSKAKSKESGVVMTEARRLAKNLVKDMMKEKGIKISHVDAKDITAAANELLGEMPELIETAKANIAAREAIPVAGKIDISAIIKVNPNKVAKAEAEKAEKRKNAPLSAKQAGKTKARGSKPGAQAPGPAPQA
jgi:hypothetical protein